MNREINKQTKTPEGYGLMKFFKDEELGESNTQELLCFDNKCINTFAQVSIIISIIQAIIK